METQEQELQTIEDTAPALTINHGLETAPETLSANGQKLLNGITDMDIESLDKLISQISDYNSHFNGFKKDTTPNTLAEELLLELGESSYNVNALMKADILLTRLILDNLDNQKQRYVIYKRFAQFCAQFCIENFGGYWENRRYDDPVIRYKKNGGPIFQPMFVTKPECYFRIPDIIEIIYEQSLLTKSSWLWLKDIGILYQRKFIEFGLCTDRIPYIKESVNGNSSMTAETAEADELSSLSQ